MRRGIIIFIAIVYFFLNSYGLPFGLTWMAVLAPFLYCYVLLRRRSPVLLPFVLLLLPFVLVQVLALRVHLTSYLFSMMNILAVYIFGMAVYTWLRETEDPDKLFRLLLAINLVFCLLSVPLYFTPMADSWWIRQNYTANVRDLLRFKLFTYEASYYALVFVPVFAWFLLGYLLERNKLKGAWLLPALFLPFILSFSIGVISCLVAAGMMVGLMYSRSLSRRRRMVNIGINTLLVLLPVLMLFLVFDDNPVVTRIENILSGNDSSAMGRTSDAFTLASRILAEHNSTWGIGPGQLNREGADLIRAYYLYYDQTPVAIPNAAAETLVLFGWAGFLLRIGAEILLFFITRVWNNYYRLLLFFFIFFYQFTGSYITNMAEYVIWIFAFTPAFSRFLVRTQPSAAIPVTS